jgi:hypothetical protein
MLCIESETEEHHVVMALAQKKLKRRMSTKSRLDCKHGEEETVYSILTNTKGEPIFIHLPHLTTSHT